MCMAKTCFTVKKIDASNHLKQEQFYHDYELAKSISVQSLKALTKQSNFLQMLCDSNFITVSWTSLDA